MAHHFIVNQDMQTSFSDNTDPNMGILSSFHQYDELSRHGDLYTSSSNLNIQSLMMGIFSSHDCFLTQQIPVAGAHDEFPAAGNLSERFPCLFLSDDDHEKNSNMVSSSSAGAGAGAGAGTAADPPFISSGNNDHMINYQHEKKRKPVDDDDQDTPAAEEESSSANSSPPPLLSDSSRRTGNSTGRGKKVKRNDKEEEKPKDVVHVRARRGQATDSHSLAERVRRGKINERLKCLQDIVPGCHKTMGMAVMLDEIINYVQSLQSQVEFLSMKLTAASNFYNFNAETDTMDFMQRAKAYEAVKMQKLLREGCDGIASTQPGHLDLTFGCHPSLPYNK